MNEGGEFTTPRAESLTPKVSVTALLAKTSGGKPPSPTCQLPGAERYSPTPACSQVGEGGLPPPSHMKSSPTAHAVGFMLPPPSAAHPPSVLPSLQKVLADEHHGRVELEVLVLLLGEAMALVLRHQVPAGRAVLADSPDHLLGLV